MSEIQKGNGRKIALGLFSLAGAAAAIVGIGYAYFSDTITGNGTATAGTLDIAGTISLQQNGEAIDGSTIANLNPGDVIGVNAGSITNNGSKSAWIRAVMEFTALSSTENTGAGGAAEAAGDLSKYLWVCTGGETQAALIAASFFTGADGGATTDDGFANSTLAYDADTNATGCKQVTTADLNTTMFGAKAGYTTADDVIDGTAEDDDETQGEAGAAQYDTTWASASMPVIYFDAAAPNAAQNGNVTFNVLVQALQYRNNTTSPTEAQWETVVSTPFAL